MNTSNLVPNADVSGRPPYLYARFAFLCTIFLNAFVDLGHKITLQNTVFKVEEGATQIILTAFINGLILLPYIVFFSLAGKASDQFQKPNVMKVSAIGAVILTSGITLSYYLGWFWVSVFLTFLLAVQSAFYYPAKLGYIRQIFGRESLAAGNSWAQAVVIVSILMGTVFFSALFEANYSAELIDKQSILSAMVFSGFLLIFFSLLEFLFALQLPIVPREMEALTQSSEARSENVVSRVFPVRHPKVMRAIWGLAVFWSAGQVTLAVFPAFAKGQLGVTNTLILQLIVASTGIGIAIGAGIAGWCAKRKKQQLHTLNTERHTLQLQDICDWRCLKIGVLGYVIGVLALPWIDSQALQAMNFLLIGIWGGLFIVPLNTAIQFYCPENVLGRVLASNNLVQNIAMLGCLFLTIAAALMATNPFGILVSMGFLVALLLGYLVLVDSRVE